MGQAKPEDIQRFNELMQRPYAERNDADHSFIKTFAKRWLAGKKSKHIMNDSPELWESFVRWEKQQKNYPDLTDDTPPAPVASTPKKQGKKAQADDDDLERYAAEELEEAGAGHEAGGETAGGGRTAAGRAIGSLLGTSGELSDEQIGQVVSGREEGNKWTGRARLAAKFALAGAVGVGAIFAGRAAWSGKQAAEKVGGNVEQIQKQVGDFADEIAVDPHKAPPTRGGQKGR